MTVQDQAFRALSRWTLKIKPVQQLNARIESELGHRHSLCMSGYEVLYYLESKNGTAPLTDVCRQVDRSQPRISRLISQLEERQMVTRTRAHSDGRAYEIVLTDKGCQVLKDAAETLLEIFDGEDVPVPSVD